MTSIMLTVKVVLLDLDGTVVKLKYRYIDAKAEVFNMLKLNGVPDYVLDSKLSLYENLERVKNYMESAGEAYRYEQILNISLKIAEKYEFEAASNPELLEGAYEALMRLKNMKLKLAIITNNCFKATELILSKLKIGKFFELIVARDDVKAMKPSPEPIKYALLKLNLRECEAVVVGDSTIDVKAALKAGVTSIGIASGVATREVLREAGANYVINGIRELPKLIEDISYGGL
ncbi:HAD family hydrolase [Candidatus Bathyarchaeota archaeon]|nr:HAD family hydrolase [Candidatus Bathyarchaeota archaeon]MBS7613943.1 HAD family hydrolase [Candidatus Bathyarchaeota archaeon]MBS7618546.1 HAD family hydrolase [Candidatus Bathyarchaeota archaeon]